MFLFGVTGGIGSGKTIVCECLRSKGLTILNSDDIAKDLINNHPIIQNRLTKQFGADIYSATHQINTQKLSQLVFENAAAREKINAIVHPFVFETIRTDAEKLYNQAKLVGVEAALIYESHMEKILNVVIVVDAPIEKRIQWVQSRNNLHVYEIEKRMKAQMPPVEKIRLADYVIHNDSDIDALIEKVEALYVWLLKQSAV